MELAEVDFAHITDDLAERFRSYDEAFNSTLVAECMWNEARHHASMNRAQKMNGDALFKELAVSGSTLASFDRPPVTVTNAARCIGAARLPATAFKPKYSSSSLSELEFDRFMAPCVGWPNMAPFVYKEIGLAWELSTQCAGDWGRIRMAWLSRLAPVGQLLRQRGKPDRAS